MFLNSSLTFTNVPLTNLFLLVEVESFLQLFDVDSVVIQLQSVHLKVSCLTGQCRCVRRLQSFHLLLVFLLNNELQKHTAYKNLHLSASHELW